MHQINSRISFCRQISSEELYHIDDAGLTCYSAPYGAYSGAVFGAAGLWEDYAGETVSKFNWCSAICQRSVPVPFAKGKVDQPVNRTWISTDIRYGDEQLGLGLSVILDAVFPMQGFRVLASDIAERHSARFKPIYCYCSDEKIWKIRIKERRNTYIPHWSPVDWYEVERFRGIFDSWQPESTLFIDTVRSYAVEGEHAKLRA